MVAPATLDITWVRGTTTPFRLAFKIDNVAIPYDDIRLSVYTSIFKGNLAFRISLLDDPAAGDGEPGAFEHEPGDISFNPTEAQTRLLKQSALELGAAGGKNSYEVEVRNGPSAEVYIMGIVAALGGINDDEA